MANRLLLVALLLAVTCPAAWAQDPAGAGAEFRVNSATTGPQNRPAVASDANGDFVVVWESDRENGSGMDIFGRRFNASGAAQGSEFQINSHTPGYQQYPVVASNANGSFVVIWQSLGQAGAGWRVFGQRFNAAGLPQGSEFDVNTSNGNQERRPAVASDPNGNFVVAWEGNEPYASDGSIFGQRFSSSGLPLGGEFQVSSFTTGYHFYPAVALDANGNFVVVWDTEGQDGSGYGIFGRRFNASGLPQGSEFRVNSTTADSQFDPSVAADANGSFVVAWTSSGQDGSGWGVFGQRFDASGLAQGSEFQINSHTTSFQGGPSVAADANGSFVVAWQSYGQDGSAYGIFGQAFNASGVPKGREFQVNSYATSDQRFPAMASAANGNFVVVWQSLGQDGSQYGVFGQRYADLIFENGFE